MTDLEGNVKFVNLDLFMESIFLLKRSLDIIGQGNYEDKSEEEIKLMSDAKNFYFKTDEVKEKLNNHSKNVL